MRIDLHTHSVVSDGTDTPTRLVLKAMEVGLDVIALTDHDTFDGIPEAIEAGKRIGVKVLCGIEMSTQVDGHSVHLLGYGCDPFHRPLVSELAKIRVARTGRLKAFAERMTELGMPLTVDDIIAAAGASPSIGRPHVADAMVAKGYVKDRDDAFDQWLRDDKPGYVPRYACELGAAIDLIHDAHGIAVLAHPWGRGNEKVLTAELIEKLATQHGLEGIEVNHPDHDERARELLFALGGRLGLIRTGSSDYHGLGKRNNPLGCENTRDTAYREMLRRIRLRGGIV
ncbi:MULTISPECIES: PHP domain-containing protein [unclassified Luteococcus]|uniref:PHP domain-containing protein n=1 Tax=unclassified Luteococcus TaxID=2639923 RepID=UPI00313C03D2